MRIEVTTVKWVGLSARVQRYPKAVNLIGVIGNLELRVICWDVKETALAVSSLAFLVIIGRVIGGVL